MITTQIENDRVETLEASSAPERTPEADAREQGARVRSLFQSLRNQIGRVFIGQTDVVDTVLYALFAGGHVLIEGIPGLGKTLLVRTLADALHLPMSRIQFTPDLMPADITGTTLLAETANGGQELRFQPGPLISNLILADEINRATPKTQSALLEAMQEHQVSVGNRTIALPDPFLVLATQNPNDQQGTYPLPEAQLDRFLVKLVVQLPDAHDLDRILESTTGLEPTAVTHRHDAADVLAARRAVRQVPVIRDVRLHAIALMLATHPDQPTAPEAVRRHIEAGAGPRAAQAMLLLAKARALVDGRFTASVQDVRAVAKPVLRHRIPLNFAGLSERVSPDAIVDSVLAKVTPRE